jgi:hypothetical protein
MRPPFPSYDTRASESSNCTMLRGRGDGSVGADISTAKEMP